MGTEKYWKLTRVFVLICIVMLGNALGTATGNANKLPLSDENSKPAQKTVKSNSDSDVSDSQKSEEFGESPARYDLFDVIVKPIPIVICIDVSTTMLEESKGGIKGFMKVNARIKYILDFLVKSSMFNIIAFTENGTKTFQDKLVAANEENKKNAKAFAEAIGTGKDKDAYEVKVTPEDKSLFVQKKGSRLDLALTASFQQGAEAILIVSDGAMSKYCSSSEIIGLIESLYEKYYRPKEMAKPVIHCIGYNIDKEGDIFLKMLAKEYKGQYRWMKKL